MNLKRTILYACIIGLIIITTGFVIYKIGGPSVQPERKKLTTTMQPTKDVLDGAVEKLKVYKGWTVEKYSGSSYSKIFNHIPEMPKPAVIVSYYGSSVDENIPQRTLNFSIIIVTKDTGDFERGALNSLELMDKIIALLDYEKYNGILFKYRSDSPLDLSTVSLSAYVLSFEGIDLGIK